MQNSHDFCSSSSNDDASASDVGINGDREFPVGYRFCPTDYELIVFYLKNKVSNLPLPHDKIPCLKISDYKPDDLAQLYKRVGGGEFWYFFTPRDRKYRNGSRPDRAADSGYWKTTGTDKSIVLDEHIKLPEPERKKKAIGYKRTLVFFYGKPPKGKKSRWIMHEFTLNYTDAPKYVRQDASDMKLDDWVLCRIHYKETKQQAAKENGLVDDKDDDQQIMTNNTRHILMNNNQRIMKNNDQHIMMNNDQQIMMNNNPQIMMNTDQQIIMKNDQQSLTNNETGYNLAQIPLYVDYNNQMDFNYMMQLQEPRYEKIYPAEEHGFNYGDFSNINPYLMMNFNNQIYSDEMIPQNAPYLGTNHYQRQPER